MNTDRPAAEEERLKALRRERFNNTEGERRYQQLVAQRAQRRQQLLSQSNVHKGSLSEAAKIVGTCTLMCPEFEREERQLKNNIAQPEMFPGTRQADPARTVKTFHRSAAGNEEPLPEDLRTPDTLQRTLDHLVNVVIAADQELRSCHGFVRDRTRSIRQDFTIQNIRDSTTVAVCERIARFHIVSLHILCGNKDFAEHQDMEQLRNTLKTLIELYDDHRKLRAVCANEAEFYAYYIVSHLRDPDAKRVAERLPRHIFTAPIVQQALKLHMLSEASTAPRRDTRTGWAAQNLGVQFFRAVASPATPLLLACLAEYYFPSIRRSALRSMCDAFPYQEGKEYPVTDFAEMLAFDSVDEVQEFCAQFNVGLRGAGVKLGERVKGRIVFQEPAQQPRRTSPNLRVVGAKFHMPPMHAINADLDSRFLSTNGRFSTSDVGQVSSANVGQFGNASLGQFGNASLGQFGTANAGFSATNGVVAPPVARNIKPVWPTAPASMQSGMDVQASSAGSASAFASGHGGVFSKPSAPSFAAPPIQFERKESVVEPTVAAAPPPQSFGNLFSKPKETTTPTTSLFPTPAAPSLFSAPAAPPAAPSVAPTPSTPSAAPALFTPPVSAPIEKPVTSEPIIKLEQKLEPEPEPISVVWNRPRHRINWTSLTNALYHDLIGSLTNEVAAPVTSQAQHAAQIAYVLATDIAQSIIDYTSAFAVYEESYRCLLFAQADTFRKRALQRRVFDQWSMETTAKLQDRALQQRYLDDLDDIIDNEYNAQPQIYACQDHPSVIPSVQPRVPVAEGFWDSLHMGAECFGIVSRALTRFGSPSFRAVVDIDGAQDASVLSSWLWWQLDPASIERCEAGRRLASYGSNEERIVFRDQSDDPVSDPVAITAQIVVLSSEPISAADVRGPSATGKQASIVTLVNRALDRARATETKSGVQPLLFVFWSTDDSRAVRRLVERTMSASGTPSYVAVNILALRVDTSKQQLGSGLKWTCRHFLQARKAALVKVSRAYEPIATALGQQLARMTSCVRALTKNEQPDASTRVAVFNLAIDTANAFLGVLNKHVFLGTDSAQLYPHASEHTGIGRGYFGSLGSHGPQPVALNAVLAAMVDDILASTGFVGEPPLSSSLQALEFVVRQQLEELRTLVSSTVYVDRSNVTHSTHNVVHEAEQRLRKSAQLCQANSMEWSPFVTPTAKRPSSLAFHGSPPSLNLGSATPIRDMGSVASGHSAAMSVSTVSTPKRHRMTESAQRLSRLQSAMARASKHLY
ncbi:actin cytoskeleton and mitosis protein [Coemansia sp. RSA 1972]|nr:actin cytoskeleton and mitosis protein [Coemansia sp. RSA 1972]